MSESSDRINAAVNAEADHLAPEDGEWFLSDWVIMGKWSSVNSDRTWVSRLTGPGTCGLMAKGLLHEGLFGDWEDED